MAGFFSSTVVADSTALGLGNAQIYLWFFKTTGNVDPNASFSNVQEQGILYADMVDQGLHNLDVINWIKNAYPVEANGMKFTRPGCALLELVLCRSIQSARKTSRLMITSRLDRFQNILTSRD